MRKLILIFLFFILSISLLPAVNGILTDMGDRYLLHVWGTHYERGEALGYLMGDQIKDLFDNYFFTTVVGSNAYVYNTYRQYHQEHFVTEDRYLQEIQGIVAGMQLAGTNLYHAGLDRELDEIDFLFINSIVDLSNAQISLACSSLSSWGNATVNDPQLQGKLQITRLLDWHRSPVLISNPLLVVHHPSEADEMKWISFTYPSLIGALSAISQEQAAAFLNVGNSHPNIDDEELSAVLLNVRNGIERRDYNNDSVYSNQDLWDALSDGNHLTGSIIHSVQEWPDSSRALIFETNNTGTVSRAHGENSGIAGDNLAATNHFRKLIDPVYCSRYAEIIDSLNQSSEVSIARQWDLMAGACGVQYNMMMIQYMPSQNTVKWSIATSYYGAYHEEAMVLDTNALFTLPSAIQDATAPQVSRLHLYPNPLGPGGVLREASEKELTRVKVYNIKGQKVYDAETLPIAEDFHASGVYIVVSEDVSGISYKNRIICSK